MHLSTKGFGADAKEFKPERWSEENTHKIHPNAYNPFGAGVRACIGSQFAMLEAKITLATIFQQLMPSLVNPNYVLENDETITLKPKNLFIHFEARAEEKGVGPTLAQEEKKEVIATSASENSASILLLFGSNMGTSEDYATLLAKQARERGLSATVLALDDAFSDIPTDGTPVIIVTSTYNGTPPDNAMQFNRWLESANAGDLTGARYTVCGTGNKQWVTTFQKFPTFIAERMKALGAEEFYERGVCDADGDIEADFEKWSEGLWPQIEALLKVTAKIPEKEKMTEGIVVDYEVDYVDFQQPNCASQSHGHDATMPQSLSLYREARDWLVLKNENIQSALSDRRTLQIELALPSHINYCAGDQFGVLPLNSQEQIKRVAKRLDLELDKVVMVYYIGQDKPEFPTEVPISIRDLLGEQVDLQGPIYRHVIRALAQLATDEKEALALKKLADDNWQEEIIFTKKSIGELLNEFSSIKMGIEELLTIFPRLKPRYYSISSSPKKFKKSCTITADVLDQPLESGNRFKGVASNYLRSVGPNGYISGFVKDTGSPFRMPKDSKTNMLLIGSGTGIAPMIGFIQERTLQKEQGESVGKTNFYFGCRRRDWDFLYREELENHLKQGALTQLEVGFSREPEEPKQYVQDKLLANAKEIWELINNEDTLIYICGNATTMAVGVREAFTKIAKEQGNMPEEQAKNYVPQLIEAERYLQDVWAPSI